MIIFAHTVIFINVLPKRNLLNNINVIYIGGGTPSSIGIDNLQILFKILQKYINFNNLIEFSIECNPKDISHELITLFKNNKVNRISLGIQSFNDEKLKLLNRNHNREIAINSLKILNEMNFNNINMIPDHRINGLSISATVKVSEYMGWFLTYGLLNKLEDQRPVMKSRSANMIRKRLVEDLKLGAVIPPIVIGFAIASGILKVNVPQLLPPRSLGQLRSSPNRSKY